MRKWFCILLFRSALDASDTYQLNALHMKNLRLFIFAAVFGLLFSAPHLASAQIRIGSHLAFEFEGSNLAIGANAQVGFNGGERRFLANPSVDFYLFEKNVTMTAINLDVAYPLFQDQSSLDGPAFSPYLGAGLLARRTGLDVPEEFQVPGVDYNDTDFGINVFVGSLFMAPDSPIRPFARVAANIGANTGVSVQGGAMFKITD